MSLAVRFCVRPEHADAADALVAAFQAKHPSAQRVAVNLPEHLRHNVVYAFRYIPDSAVDDLKELRFNVGHHANAFGFVPEDKDHAAWDEVDDDDLTAMERIQFEQRNAHLVRRPAGESQPSKKQRLEDGAGAAAADWLYELPPEEKRYLDVSEDLKAWDPLESTCRHASLSIL